jgi:thiamine biosynthesis lipoprotein
MGTLLALSLPPMSPERETDYSQLTFETARTCDDVMSTHRPDTAVSQLNRLAGHATPVASRDLGEALILAQQLAQSTDGAFDPTVGPLVHLWRGAARRGVCPTGRRLRQTLDAVNWRALRVSGTGISLERRGMAVDLGGFGKGVTLDRIGAQLQNAGCAAALLNFGESSVVAIGRGSKRGWPIVLRHPRGGFIGEFPLGNRACSTSATFGRPLRVGARCVSPVVDPRSGRPVSHVAQVTVLAERAAVAEAASTAMLVEGRAAMEGLAQRLNVDACWIDRSGVHTTTWFPLRRFE